MKAGNVKRMWSKSAVARMTGLWMASAVAVSAADLTWNGGVSGVWVSSGGGWLDGVTPANWSSDMPDNAFFTGTSPLNVQVNFDGVTADGLSFSGASYTVEGVGILELSGGLVRVDAAVTATVSAAMSGSVGLTKDGGGTLILTNANKNYAGVLTVSNGAVRIFGTQAGILGATATQQVVLAGGRLEAQFPGNLTPSNTIVIGAAGGELRNLGNDSQRWIISGGRVAGAGTATLSFGASSSRYQITGGQGGFTGKWIVDSSGTANKYIDVFSSTAFGGATGADAITLLNSGSIALRPGVTLGSVTQGIALGVGSARILATGGSTGVVAAAISGPTSNAVQFATENAGSLLIISNTANSWLGETTINGPGIVRLGTDGVLPDNGRNVVINGGATLDLNDADETIPGLFGSGVVDNLGTGSSRLTAGVNNENPSFSGSLRNSGPGAVLDFIKVGSGIQTLSGTNTFDGLTRVEGGILLLSGQGSIANSFRIDVLAGATLSANTRTDGTFTLGASQLLTGAGNLRGNVTNNGAIWTGTDGAGTLVVSGQYAQAASGSLSVTVIDGMASGLRVTGPATLNGGLVVDREGAEPALGTVVTAVTMSARSGAFASTNLFALSPGLGWDVTYTSTSVLLSVTGAPPAAGYADWASAITNGLTNYNDSATGDGYPNLLKYATGSSPTNSDALARMGGSLAAGVLSLTFNRNTNATDVTLIVEASDSLANHATWTGITTNKLGVWNPPVAVETGAGSPVQVRVHDIVTAGTSRYMRLIVTIP